VGVFVVRRPEPDVVGAGQDVAVIDARTYEVPDASVTPLGVASTALLAGTVVGVCDVNRPMYVVDSRVPVLRGTSPIR
jgi:hypothetical protein